MLINVLMKNILKKNSLKEIKKETLKNILSSKGIIYHYYLRSLQQKRQSNRLVLPKK